MERINALEKEIAEIRKTLNEKESLLYELKKNWTAGQASLDERLSCGEPQPPLDDVNNSSKRLPKWAIERYSRQILLPEIGVEGQKRLMGARVLVVGAGGLGCPAAIYLAGAGVGEIGLVDDDSVELSNLHRQVLHGERDRGTSKAHSAAHSLRQLNSHITVTPHDVKLESSNAMELVSGYHVVLDCTDNAPTRYLLNDACVLSELPLISGSALKMEGQITIYGYRADKHRNYKAGSAGSAGSAAGGEEGARGPCYRCVFPAPPPPDAVGSCADSGVVGPLPALIGALQALECIKYLVGSGRERLLVGRMLVADGEDASFRTVRLRPASASCAVCSSQRTITAPRLLDYETFCRARATDQVLCPSQRVTATELAARLLRGGGRGGGEREGEGTHLVVDVRSEAEFYMCRLPAAVNYPMQRLTNEQVLELARRVRAGCHVTFVCRRGNDSQLAARRLLHELPARHHERVRDLAGGLHAWARTLDPHFPLY